MTTTTRQPQVLTSQRGKIFHIFEYIINYPKTIVDLPPGACLTRVEVLGAVFS